jgi:hypothetical protein
LFRTRAKDDRFALRMGSEEGKCPRELFLCWNDRIRLLEFLRRSGLRAGVDGDDLGLLYAVESLRSYNDDMRYERVDCVNMILR